MVAMNIQPLQLSSTPNDDTLTSTNHVPLTPRKSPLSLKPVTGLDFSSGAGLKIFKFLTKLLFNNFFLHV